MSEDDKKDEKIDKSVMQKAIDLVVGVMDDRITKAKAPDLAPEDEGEDTLYRKSVYRDPSYSVGTQGYQEKTARLSFPLLREMANKDIIVAGIIQTRQNQVAAYSKPAKDRHEKGFKIVLAEEESKLEDLKEEMFGEQLDKKAQEAEVKSEDDIQKVDDIQKAEPEEREGSTEQDSEDARQEGNEISAEGFEQSDDTDGKPEELSEKEMDRMAREELKKRTKKRVEEIKKLVMSCGSLKDRDFETKHWNFDKFLRAIVRDSLTYDWYAVERVPDNKDKLHHWVPSDSATIRYSTPQLKLYTDQISNDAGYDIIYPEKELEAMKQEDSDVLKLDNEKLDKDEYKYVQVIRGKIERAFTEGEMAIGMRNPTTDIYANGYSISELERLITTVSSHISTEAFNRDYFTQGFSAKGILHIKAALPRRKLETLRIQWKHLVSGNKNNFQTPILAGMEEVQWIPLNQNHADMEFSNWMNYLIKAICMIYQIDPYEIGFGMKDDVSKGSMNGDNTKEKIDSSKERGLEPLLRNIEQFMNDNIISKIDPDYKLEFVGISEESRKQALERIEKEVKTAKSVNEVRDELGLPPIEGADDLILDPVYFQWFQAFHPVGQETAQKMKDQDLAHGMIQNGQMAHPNQEKLFESKDEAPQVPGQKPEEKQEVKKSESLVKVEHYTIKED